MVAVRCTLLLWLRKWKATRKFIVSFCDPGKIIEEQIITEEAVVTYTNFGRCSKDSWKNGRISANDNMTIVSSMMMISRHTLSGRNAWRRFYLYRNGPLKHYSKSKLTRPTLKKTGKHIKIVAQHKNTTVANLTVMMISPLMPKLWSVAWHNMDSLSHFNYKKIPCNKTHWQRGSNIWISNIFDLIGSTMRSNA